MPLHDPRPEDFFEWETEMTESKNEPEKPGIIAKLLGGVILSMVVAFVIILLGKAIVWAVHL